MSESVLGKAYAVGQYVVRQGDTGECMYVVQMGQLEVLKEGRDGEVRIGLLDVGDYFGEMSMFGGETRSASVRALENSRVRTITKDSFMRCAKEEPALALSLVKTMSQRIRLLTEEVVRLKAKAGE